MIVGPGRRGRAGREGRPAARCRSRPTPSPRRSGYQRITDFAIRHLARPRRLHEVRQVPRGVPGDRVRLPALAAGSDPRPAGVRGGLAGDPVDPRGAAALRSRRIDPRRPDPPGDSLVVHAVHGVRRDLPGRDRARADHQPDAPRPRRARRDGLAAPVDARDDLHVRQLLRRGEAQARALGEGARLRAQGRPQGAGRVPLVRRRLRIVRSRATSATRRRSPGSSTTRASTSGSSTTPRRPPATTSAASARKACTPRSPRRTSRRSASAISSGSSRATRTPSTRCRTSTRSSAPGGRPTT